MKCIVLTATLFSSYLWAHSSQNEDISLVERNTRVLHNKLNDRIRSLETTSICLNARILFLESDKWLTDQEKHVFDVKMQNLIKKYGSPKNSLNREGFCKKLRIISEE